MSFGWGYNWGYNWGGNDELNVEDIIVVQQTDILSVVAIPFSAYSLSSVPASTIGIIVSIPFTMQQIIGKLSFSVAWLGGEVTW